MSTQKAEVFKTCYTLPNSQQWPKNPKHRLGQVWLPRATGSLILSPAFHVLSLQKEGTDHYTRGPILCRPNRPSHRLYTCTALQQPQFILTNSLFIILALSLFPSWRFPVEIMLLHQVYRGDYRTVWKRRGQFTTVLGSREVATIVPISDTEIETQSHTAIGQPYLSVWRWTLAQELSAWILPQTFKSYWRSWEATTWKSKMLDYECGSQSICSKSQCSQQCRAGLQKCSGTHVCTYECEVTLLAAQTLAPNHPREGTYVALSKINCHEGVRNKAQSP